MSTVTDPIADQFAAAAHSRLQHVPLSTVKPGTEFEYEHRRYLLTGDNDEDVTGYTLAVEITQERRGHTRRFTIDVIVTLPDHPLLPSGTAR